MTKENEKKTEIKVRFAVNDCPLEVYRGVVEPAKVYCNDQYWVRIKELLDKEQQLATLTLALNNNQSGEERPRSDEILAEVKPSKYLGSRKREEKENETKD